MDIIIIPFHDYKKWIHEGFRTRDAHVLQHLMGDQRIGKILVVNRPVSLAEMLLKHTSWKTLTDDVVYHEKQMQLTQMEKNVWCVDIFLPDFLRVVKERKRWWFSAFCRPFVLKKIQNAVSYLQMKDTVLFLQNPMVVGVIDAIPHKILAFDAIDNWLHHPQMHDSYDLVQKNYQIINEKADVIFTVSKALTKIFPTNANVHWIANGVDISFFSDAFCQQKVPSDPIVIGYVGKIQERVDFDLVERCLNACPDCIFEICGPVYAQQKKVRQLDAAYSNIHFTGDIHYHDLPDEMRKMDIAIIPHKINSFTESMNPLKLYEYLAAGKMVVTTAVAGTEAISPYVRNCADSDSFVSELQKLVQQIQQSPIESEKIQSSIPLECSWDFRTQQMLGLFEKTLVKKQPQKGCKIGFVILHYLTTEDTLQCVKSILMHVPVEKRIVIVDNGSNNGSFELLQKKLKNLSEIILIRSNENLGFAKGNNLGIQVLQEKFCCPFTVVLNNDTTIEQDGWYDQIQKEYEESEFAVLGPKIITQDGAITSNPVREAPLSEKAIDNLILRRWLKLLLCKFGLHRLIHPAGTKISISSIDHEERYENVQLHGACIIFSEKFFEKFSGFDSRTFLYFEEDILFHHLLHNQLKSVYLPTLELHHAEDSATNASMKSNRSKNIFVFSNEIRSLKILKQLKKQQK